MLSKARIPLLALAVLLFGVISAAASATETYIGRLIAEDLFDKLKFQGRIAVWPVDATQAQNAGLTPAAAATLADNIRAAVHQIGLQKGLTFVERQAISKVFQEQQFSHNATDSQFEALAHQARADALVLISFERKNPAEIVVSARLVKANGTAAGQILATSKSYEVAMAQSQASAPAAAPSAQAQVAQAPQAAAAIPTPGTVTPTYYAAPTYYQTQTYYPAYAYSPGPVYYSAPTYYAPRYYYRPAVAVHWGRR